MNEYKNEDVCAKSYLDLAWHASLKWKVCFAWYNALITPFSKQWHMPILIFEGNLKLWVSLLALYVFV